MLGSNINLSTQSDLYNLANRYISSSGTAPLQALHGLTSVGPVPWSAQSDTLYAIGRQEASFKVKLSAYGKLRSAFDEFSTALSKLDTLNEVAPFKATSSKESVLKAEAGKDTTTSGTYAVDVSQLARGQTLQSATFADSDSTIVGNGSLKVEVGSYNANLNTFSPSSSGAKSVIIPTGNGTLGGIANAINQADIGLKAKVVEADGGGYKLELSTTATGTDNTVRISASDVSGSPVTGNSGLGQLAYDPTATAGAGKNLTQTQTAQNAQLTVDGKSVASQSNDVTEAIKGVTLKLAETGSTSVTVNVNRDVGAFEQSAKTFVDTYNTLQKAVQDLTKASAKESNPPLAQDALTQKLVANVRSTLDGISSGYGSDALTLKDVGITTKSDGTLTLNTDTLRSAFADNPETAGRVLAGAAERLGALAARDTSSTSELQFTTQTLDRTLQDLNSRRVQLQDYNVQVTQFGLPTQYYSLFTYLFSNNGSAGAARYSAVSRL